MFMSKVGAVVSAPSTHTAGWSWWAYLALALAAAVVWVSVRRKDGVREEQSDGRLPVGSEIVAADGPAQGSRSVVWNPRMSADFTLLEPDVPERFGRR
jgi:hypothetical protein